jgi:flagellar FliL protein
MAKRKKDAPKDEDEDDVKADAADGESEGTEEGAEGEGAKKKIFGIPKLALFIGAPVLLLLIVGVAGAFMFGLIGGKPDKEAAKPKVAATDLSQVQFYDLPEMLVNLNTGGKSETYLKLQVAIEIPKDVQPAQIQPALPRITDQFQVFLRELRLEDLSGSAGTYRLKEELLRRIKLSGLPVKVYDVLIREMLIQ